MEEFVSWVAGSNIPSSKRERDIEVDSIPAHLRQLLKELDQQIEVRSHTPVVIGSGFATATHKIAACLHSFSLGHPNLASLREFLSSIVSWTTDQGLKG